MLYWLTNAERFDFGREMAGFLEAVVVESAGDDASEEAGVGLFDREENRMKE
jgi:hypothetical protein